MYQITLNQLHIVYIFTLVALILSGNAQKDPANVPKSPKPAAHIAVFSGCDSRISVTKPVTHTLLNKVSTPGKYRITYVTGNQCKDVSKDLGADFHDSGTWYYPSPKTSHNNYDFFNNLTTSSVLYSYNGMVSLIEKDKPDLIIAECFGVGAATAAEQHDIPFAFIWTPALPHISTWGKGQELTIGLTMDYVPSEFNPDWMFKLHTYLFHSIYISYINLLGQQAITQLKNIRDSLGLPMFDNFEHTINSFPSISLAGQPLTQMMDVPPNLMVAGILPLPPEKSSADPDVVAFLDKSDKPVLYVALGTFFAYSDYQFGEVFKALKEQDKFNVLWSHKFYDESKFPVGDKHKFLIKTRMPQKHILNHEKVKLFLTHCGMSSTVEGVTGGVAFLTSPQGRDQYYIEDMLRRAKLSYPLGKYPTKDSVLKAVQHMSDNLELYTNNVKNVYKKLSEGSEKKLENFIDSLIAQKHSTRFDLEISNIWSFKQAMMFLTSLILGVLVGLVLFFKIVYCTVRSLLTPSGNKQRKTKTN